MRVSSPLEPVAETLPPDECAYPTAACSACSAAIATERNPAASTVVSTIAFIPMHEFIIRW